MTLRHARAGHAVEELLDLGRTVDELVAPEVERGVLDELDERDEKAPRVRAIYDQTLEEYPEGGAGEGSKEVTKRSDYTRIDGTSRSTKTVDEADSAGIIADNSATERRHRKSAEPMV